MRALWLWPGKNLGQGPESTHQRRAGKSSFYGYDAHGNVCFLWNTAGTVTDTQQSDASAT